FVLLIILSSWMIIPDTNAQIKHNLGLGFNLGGQQIRGDIDSDLGLAAEGVASYMVQSRNFGLTAGLGFGSLKSHTKTKPPTGEFTTNMITVDLKGVFWLLSQRTFNPYIFAGLGIFNFSFPTSSSKRFFDGSVIIGSGFEWMLNPKLGLNTTLDYRYTTGDDFDAHRGGTTDGYLNGRVGLTFYFRNKSEMSTPPVLARDTDFDPGLIGDDTTASDANQSNYDEQEFVALRSRLDNLNEKITEKENEIRELKVLITERNTEIVNKEKEKPQQLSKPPKANSAAGAAVAGDFAARYETGLERFYQRDYETTISIMSALIQTEPGNHLTSNCQYWIGEAYYGQRAYPDAVAAFEKVLQYPNSPKLDDALLMLGKCYLSTGQRDQAKKLFSQLIQEYPDSEYIEKAEAFLSNL
ncbi:tetratricopeptide repeat protein, partial [candidate division KSB1 bacterium]|nr:tetratricopeptide repeat protein [candidate division KSB1 bacterium]